MTLTDREISKDERALFRLINNYRASLNVRQLVFDDRLNRAADDKVACFALNGVEPIHHTCRGETSEQLREEFGYTAPGSEILCWSEKTAESAFNTWRNSPIHDAVMRDPQYRAVGITGPSQAGKYWGTWVVEFGTEALSKPAGAPTTDAGARNIVESRKETVIASFDSPISTIPAPLRTGGTIDRDTPIRLIGDCRKVVANGVLDYAKSPVMPEFEAVFAAIAGHSIAILAIMAKETEYGRTANVRNNGWNTIDTGAGFTVYASWAEGAKAAMRRFADYAYKGGVYEPEITVAEFIQTWQGGPECRTSGYERCANGETRDSIELAITQFLDRANRIIKANGSGADTPATTTTPKPTTPGKITFGRVPTPKNYSERIIAPGVNSAWDNLGARKPRGMVLHRMLGTLAGTDSYFRGAARSSACTDFGIGQGKVYRWTQPGANVAPWASGPANGIDGDGAPFWQKYKNDPAGVGIFNRDCESIEIEGLTYESPVPDADYQRLVELVAWRADNWLRISFEVWPLNNDGVHCLLGHSEITNDKPCPGAVVYGLVGRLIEDVRAVLKQYQTA